MPWREAPVVDFEQQPEFQWPFWEVGCREAYLFGELHQRFNTVPNPTFIQETNAWHADVSELARTSATKDEFMSRLQRRRDERLEELQDFREKLYVLLRLGYNCLDDTQSFHLTRLNAFATLDTIVAFYATLLAPNKDGGEPSLGSSTTPLRHLVLTQSQSDSSPASNDATCGVKLISRDTPSRPGPNVSSSTNVNQLLSDKADQGESTGGDRKCKASRFDTDPEQCCKRLRSNITTSAQVPASPSVDSSDKLPDHFPAQSAKAQAKDNNGRRLKKSRDGAQKTIAAATKPLDPQRAKSRSRQQPKRGAVGKQKKSARTQGLFIKHDGSRREL